MSAKLFSAIRHKLSICLVSDIIILIFISAAIILIEREWMTAYSYTPEGDYALHLAEASSFCATISQISNPLTALITAWLWPGSYPAGVYTITLIFTKIFGGGLAGVLYSQMAFIPIVCFSIYFLQKSEGQAITSKAAGIAAVLLTFGIPEYLCWSRQYLLDFPLSAATAACICLLSASHSFSRKAASVLFGIALGLSFLIKFTIVFFVAVPLIIAAAANLKDWRKCAGHLATQALAAFIVFLTFLSFAKLSSAIPRQIVELGTLIPPASLHILSGIIIICVIWFAGASYSFKGPASATLANFTRALAAGALIGAPWIICNTATVSTRSAPIIGEIIRNINLAPEYFGFLREFEPGVIFLAALAAGLAVSFLKSSPFSQKLTAASFISGILINYPALGVAKRYLTSSMVLASSLVINTFKKIPGGVWAVLALSLAVFHYNLIEPVFGPANPRPSKAISLVRAEFPPQPHAEACPFTAALQCAELLQLPDRHANVAIGFCKKEPRFSFEAWYGFQSWSDWHGRPYFPVIISLEGARLMPQHMLRYLSCRMVQHYAGKDPSFLERISADTINLTPVPGTWDFYVNVAAGQQEDASCAAILGQAELLKKVTCPEFTLYCYKKSAQ